MPNSCGIGFGIYLAPLCDGLVKAGRNFFAAGAPPPPNLALAADTTLLGLEPRPEGCKFTELDGETDVFTVDTGVPAAR